MVETDEAMVALFTLLIGSKVIDHPEGRKGVDDALSGIKDFFLKNGKSKAAGLVEMIRSRSTDGRADPSLIKLLRLDAGGSA